MAKERKDASELQQVKIGEKFSITPNSEVEALIYVNNLGRLSFSFDRVNLLDTEGLGNLKAKRYFTPEELEISFKVINTDLATNYDSMPVTIFGIIDLLQPIHDDRVDDFEFSALIDGKKYMFPCDGVGGDTEGNVYNICLGTLTDNENREVLVKADKETLQNIQFLVTDKRVK